MAIKRARTEEIGTRENAERRGTIRELSDRAAKQSDEIRVMRDAIAETCARLGVEGTGSTVDDAQVIWREISRRLMPEGMEWPRFESGEPVRIGDVVSDVEVRSVVFRDGGILLSDCTSVPGWGTWRSYKEPIKRPIADTWERLDKDAKAAVCVYFGVGDRDCGSCGLNPWECAYDKARDLVRRCRALAERERGE